MATLDRAQVIEYLSSLDPEQLDEVIEVLEERLGIERFASPALNWPVTMGVAEVDERRPDARDVVLVHGGDARIPVIKALRARLGCSLSDARAIVDRCPTVVASDLHDDEATAWSDALRSAGAEVEIR